MHRGKASMHFCLSVCNLMIETKTLDISQKIKDVDLVGAIQFHHLDTVLRGRLHLPSNDEFS